jgi:flagellar motor switch protein FliN/FliY
MTQLDEALASPEWAFALAAALEEQLGDNRILTVGTAGAGVANLSGDATMRAAAVSFAADDGPGGLLVLVAFPALAQALELASGATLLDACSEGFEAAIDVVAEQAVARLRIDRADEIDPDALRDDPGDAEVVYPLLDGSELLGIVALRVATNSTVSRATADSDADSDAPPIEADAAPVPSGAPDVLADVEMGVTAELGRSRMTVRELLSITPGAVIDLDRAAGAPVDVLVNGTLIARGEVVVVDEEFAIRISELVAQSTKTSTGR